MLSLYELELFYDEVLQRLRELSIECLSVENTVCQVLDMINPREKREWGEGGRDGGRERGERGREGGSRRGKMVNIKREGRHLETTV